MATAIKNRGISITALGIGAADSVELASYASSPEDIVSVQDFSQLDEKVVETAEKLCPSKLC